MHTKVFSKRRFLQALALTALIPTHGFAGSERRRRNDGSVQPKNLISAVQRALTERGFKPGKADGIMGTNTERAIKAFQASADLPVDGRISPQLLNAIGL